MNLWYAAGYYITVALGRLFFRFRISTASGAF